MITIYIVIRLTTVAYSNMRMTVSCRYCIAFEVMLLFLVRMVIDCQVYFGFDLPSVIIDRQSKKCLSVNVNVF